MGEAGEDISGLVNGKAGESAQPKEEKSSGTPSEKDEPVKEEAKTAEKAAAPSGSTIDISKLDEVVLMPRLSDTMTEGVIASWAKNIGDDVKKGIYWLKSRPIKLPWSWKAIKMVNYYTRAQKPAIKYR
ncbi:lipoyl domain-containing protein [Niabella hibiscisoli]|nr:lipoyl domain-containing protein [Niabella hibiscisoli]MCH5717620.1 lipoyl domain-containing protein [Niabella hibiscisoli]